MNKTNNTRKIKTVELQKLIINELEKIRKLLSQYDNRDYVQLACFFREEKYILQELKLSDDWLSYYYLFGLVFKTRDVLKSLIEKEIDKEKVKELDANFHINDYVKVCTFNTLIDIVEKFGSQENFITIVRSAILAHPFTTHKIGGKQHKYILERVKTSNEIGSVADRIFNLINEHDIKQLEKNTFIIKIQVYEKNEALSNENEESDKLTIKFYNSLFIDYIKYLRKTLIEILQNKKTSETIEREKNVEDITFLKSDAQPKAKIGRIIKNVCRTFKDDIELGFNNWFYNYLKYLQNNFNETIANFIIEASIKSLINNNFILIDFNLIDNYLNDLNIHFYKSTNDWLEYINAEEEIKFKELIDKINNTFIGDLDKFPYFFVCYLEYILDIDDIKKCKTYGDLMNLLFLKEIELQKGGIKNENNTKIF